MKDKQKHYKGWAYETVNCSNNLVYLRYLRKHFNQFALYNELPERDRSRLLKLINYRIQKVEIKHMD